MTKYTLRTAGAELDPSRRQSLMSLPATWQVKFLTRLNKPERTVQERFDTFFAWAVEQLSHEEREHYAKGYETWVNGVLAANRNRDEMNDPANEAAFICTHST